MDITRDAALMRRVLANEFCGDGSASAPVGFPPGPNGYWPTILQDWCIRVGIACTPADTPIYGVQAKVTKQQVLAFVEHCYGGLPSYTDPARMLTWKGEAYLAVRLINLRAFLAQNLKGNRSYFLVATEDG